MAALGRGGLKFQKSSAYFLLLFMSLLALKWAPLFPRFLADVVAGVGLLNLPMVWESCFALCAQA